MKLLTGLIVAAAALATSAPSFAQTTSGSDKPTSFAQPYVGGGGSAQPKEYNSGANSGSGGAYSFSQPYAGGGGSAHPGQDKSGNASATQPKQ